MDLMESVSRKLRSGSEGERQKELWQGVYEAFVDRGEEGVTEEIRAQWQAKERDLLQLISEIRDTL